MPRLRGFKPYLKERLAKGADFNPNWDMKKAFRGRQTKKQGPGTGKLYGAYTDHAVQKVFHGKKKLSPNQPQDKQAIMFFAKLKEMNIKLVNVQTKAVNENIGVRTEVDGIGLDMKTGKKIVIELKTTQTSMERHRDKYHVTCRNQPKLMNGFENSEYWHHALQAGFGAWCLNLHRAVVIMVCLDGALSYEVPRMIIGPTSFPIWSGNRLGGLETPKFLEWPLPAAYPQTIRNWLKKHGCKQTPTMDGKIAIFNHQKEQKKYVVGIINSQISQKNKLSSKKILVKHRTKLGKPGKGRKERAKVEAYLACLNPGKGIRFNKV